MVEFPTAGGEPSDRRSELSWLLQEGLGHSVDDRTLDVLAAIHARLEKQQTELAQLLESNSISQEAYLVELDQAMRQTAKLGEDLLGYDDFHKVFGEFSASSVIDPASFFESKFRAG
ncbi:hypothetical protein [Bradyrhizobium sp.]|uniref:hypothetical protein n=1 Tax=Bradyrhizobium sp. TaxID=376 RepID=UPI002389150A|nr:hypothetical protein [Bradyrhizobium sp.]MDE2378676.1 hypothetical protein [Bradyrhizobium sp.]